MRSSSRRRLPARCATTAQRARGGSGTESRHPGWPYLLNLCPTPDAAGQGWGGLRPIFARNAVLPLTFSRPAPAVASAGSYRSDNSLLGGCLGPANRRQPGNYIGAPDCHPVDTPDSGALTEGSALAPWRVRRRYYVPASATERFQGQLQRPSRGTGSRSLAGQREACCCPGCLRFASERQPGKSPRTGHRRERADAFRPGCTSQ